MKHTSYAKQYNVVALSIKTPLAQSVERKDFKLVVVDSIPTGGVIEGAKEVSLFYLVQPYDA